MASTLRVWPFSVTTGRLCNCFSVDETVRPTILSPMPSPMRVRERVP